MPGELGVPMVLGGADVLGETAGKFLCGGLTSTLFRCGSLVGFCTAGLGTCRFEPLFGTPGAVGDTAGAPGVPTPGDVGAVLVPPGLLPDVPPLEPDVPCARAKVGDNANAIKAAARCFMKDQRGALPFGCPPGRFTHLFDPI